MYRIMIIDDNHLSVDGIYKNISWEALDAEVVFQAYDGKAAMDILEKESVDLMISDIEMPQLDGLTMAKQALAINSTIKIILISAFDKFEYAKQAVRIGAFDYVEKPLDYEYLYRIIEEALKVLSQEKKNLDILKKSKPVMIDNFFTEVLNSTPDEAKYALENYQDYLSLNLNYHCFQVVVVRIDNAKEVKGGFGIEEFHIRLMGLSDYVKSVLKEHFRLIHILTNFNEIKVIIGHNYSSDRFFHKLSAEIFTALSDAYQDKLFNLSIGIGRVVNYFWELSVSYENACKALEYCFFFPQKNVFDIRDTLGKELPGELFQKSYEDQLIQLICKKNIEEIKEWLQNVSEELLSNYRTKQLVFIQVYSMLVRLLKFLCEMDIDTQDIEREIMDAYSKVDPFNSGNEIFEWLYHICYVICKKMDTSVKTYHERTCASVIEYIKKHYHESSLCLNNIADHVNVSPAHLSALFKKNRGENITDIITTIRIDSACQMLKNTTSSLKQISERIGYTNQYYFSACFKKKTGMTPSVYREKVD